jgi:hypothetical protein
MPCGRPDDSDGFRREAGDGRAVGVEARSLVARMVENGLSADRNTVEQIVAPLTASYGR